MKQFLKDKKAMLILGVLLVLGKIGRASCRERV